MMTKAGAPVDRAAWGRRAGLALREMRLGAEEVSKLPPATYMGVSLREIGREGAKEWVLRKRAYRVAPRCCYDPLGEVFS